MDADACIRNTVLFVKESFSGDQSAHDWWHIYRVWTLATDIAMQEYADLLIVQLAALLHDNVDWKFDGDKGLEKVRTFLQTQDIPKESVDPVCAIIQNVSYKGAGVPTPMKTLEGMVVQDADRLDALGAIGIARAFAYGGFKNRPLYDPEIQPQLHQSFEAYKSNTKSHTINHFYEKLLLLKERMHTKTAKQMAQERHVFMETFLKKFFAEWDRKE